MPEFFAVAESAGAASADATESAGEAPAAAAKKPAAKKPAAKKPAAKKPAANNIARGIEAALDVEAPARYLKFIEEDEYKEHQGKFAVDLVGYSEDTKLKVRFDRKTLIDAFLDNDIDREENPSSFPSPSGGFSVRILLPRVELRAGRRALRRGI